MALEEALLAADAVSKSFLPAINDELLVVAWLARLCERANEALAKKDKRPMEMSLTLHLNGGERRVRETRFSREGIGAYARAFRAERLLRELWQGEEVERIVLSFGALEPLVAEQTLLGKRLPWFASAERLEEYLDTTPQARALKIAREK